MCSARQTGVPPDGFSFAIRLNRTAFEYASTDKQLTSTADTSTWRGEPPEPAVVPAGPRHPAPWIRLGPCCLLLG